MTNETDIKKAFDKDKERGFRMLVDKYKESIYFYIRRMVVVHADAEDVMQETFIRIFRGLDGFRNESNISTWIFRIATNECIKFLERQRRTTIPTAELQNVLAEKLKATDYVDYDNVMAVKFQEALLHLPEKQQIVFNLRYYEEMDYNEISKITGTSVDSLKTSYHYAKDKIKNYILNA
jgi:RNA polymerase sigma-70 factor (ECF subfamily)